MTGRTASATVKMAVMMKAIAFMANIKPVIAAVWNPHYYVCCHTFIGFVHEVQEKTLPETLKKKEKKRRD